MHAITSDDNSQDMPPSSISVEESTASSSALTMDTLSYEIFKRCRDRIELERDIAATTATGIDSTHNSLMTKTPNEFITQILSELRYPKSTNHELSGVQKLLQSSTHSWRTTLYKSVGCQIEPPPLSLDLTSSQANETNQAKTMIDETQIAKSLLKAFSNVNSQFGILVGMANEKEFVLDFPTEPVEYDGGECWVECRVRDKYTDELLVVMGWTLVKNRQRADDDNNNNDSSTTNTPSLSCRWFIDSIDWQDFRDEFRPGIGREDWPRICG